MISAFPIARRLDRSQRDLDSPGSIDCSWQKIGRILIDGNGVIGMVFYQVDGSKTAHAFFIAGIEVQGQQVRMLFTNVGGSKWLSVDEFERLWSKVDDEFWIYAGWQVRSNV
jgi:hypothetical protein